MLTLSPPIPLRLCTMPYWSNPPVLIFDIRALWPQLWAPECPSAKNQNWWVRPVWHWTLQTVTIWNISWHFLKGLSLLLGSKISFLNVFWLQRSATCAYGRTCGADTSYNDLVSIMLLFILVVIGGVFTIIVAVALCARCRAILKQRWHLSTYSL